MTPWDIQGTELINCNCSYGCPCQFNALPTKGFCEAMGAISIEKGHFGEVPLDGLKIGVVFSWPGPIHEGKGKCQPIVDTNASAQQREALLKIMSGQETEPFATMFAVYASTMETVYEPIFTKIDYDVNVEGRRGEVHIQDVFDLVAEPSRSATPSPARNTVPALTCRTGLNMKWRKWVLRPAGPWANSRLT